MSNTVEQFRGSTAVRSERVMASESPAPAKAVSGRLVSLDAFRGFIMLMLVSHGFGFYALTHHPQFSWLANQFEHAEWEGLTFWDLIQPAFMFMVGVAMPFSFARRISQGDSVWLLFRHVVWRSITLVLLSQVLMSVSDNQLSFQLINVLCQIALTYFFCFLIMQLPFRLQIIAAVLVLTVHWTIFVLFPGSEGAFSKVDNVGARIDFAILGRNYRDYYVTVNFISSIVTTLFGVWTGQFLMKRRSHTTNLKVISAAAFSCFLLGFVLKPSNPMIKHLWTESFTFISAGWVLLMLLAFYWLVEAREYQKPVFPLVVLGMNSIFIYSFSFLLRGGIDRGVALFTGGFASAGLFAPVLQAITVLLVMWYVCYWLYQRKIFFRL